MKQTVFWLTAIAALVGMVGFRAPEWEHAQQESSPVFVTEKPAGYRDWKLISVAHEEGTLNSFGAILGNDVAIKAYREGKLPFPDGAIIAALHFRYTKSDENNKVFGREQSFVPGAATNTQFMVKDSKKYAATGGWGFGHFNADGKPVTDDFMKTCYPCHAKVAASDLVFTHYAAPHDKGPESETPASSGVSLPRGYRDWRLISVAHEEGNLNDLRAILGNDAAVSAFRQGKLPLPDGAIISRLAWNYVPSEENNKVFGRAQSFVAGDPTNVQFMVKDSAKYAATGGWGFAQFKNGRVDEKADLKTCFPCHVPVKTRDFVFTRYAP